MIEMQVRVEHMRDLIRSYAGRCQRRRQQFAVAMNCAHLGGLLVADAGFDQHHSVAGAHDHTVGPQHDPILLIRSGAAAPQRLGNDAEHGAAIEQKGTIRAEQKLEVA